MSRKDFILIADTINNLWLKGPDAEDVRRRIAGTFADSLESTNYQFNRELFIQAATGIVPINARKARV